MSMSAEAPHDEEPIEDAVPQAGIEDKVPSSADYYVRKPRVRDSVLFAGLFGLAVMTPLALAAYEANVTLPPGMFRIEPNMFPPDSKPADQPHRTVTLRGTKYGAEHPRDKHFGTVIGVPAAEVTAWEREGCDHPVIGFETNGSVMDGYSLDGMSQLGTITLNGEQFRAVVKMADLTTSHVALGCAAEVSGDVRWSSSTVDLSGGPLPYIDAKNMGVPGVI